MTSLTPSLLRFGSIIIGRIANNLIEEKIIIMEKVVSWFLI